MQNFEKNRKVQEYSDSEDGVPHFYKQVFAFIGPVLSFVGNGTVIGFSSILLHVLDDPASEIKVDRNQLSWITSITPLAMILGCLLSGLSMERFGRRFTILSFSLVSASGWCFIYFGTSITWLLCGRFLNGLGGGLSGAATVCYLGEVSHPKYREQFLSGTHAAAASGALITSILSVYVSWRSTVLVVVIVPVLNWFLVYFLPESFVWYVNVNKLAKARKSYSWFRGDDEDDLEEFLELLANRRKNTDTLWKPQFIKPLFIASLVLVTAHVSGYHVVSFAVMKNLDKWIDDHITIVIYDALTMITAGVGCLLATRYNIRPVFLISGFVSSASLFILSITFYLTMEDPKLSAIPVVPLVPFVIFLSAGMLSLEQTVCGTIFSPKTRGLGVGVSSSFGFLAVFAMSKTNPYLLDTLNEHGTYLLYATLVLCGTSVLYFVLPETKGKTMFEIEECFREKSKDGSAFVKCSDSGKLCYFLVK